MADLERFVQAQAATYPAATAELRAGRKRTHWMWFVFPQLAGLGRSETARFYAIDDLAHARDYLVHSVLGPRLRECAGIVAASPADSARELFGEVDAMKLGSSMTLFSLAAPDEPVFTQVLDKYFHGARDPATMRLLGSTP